MKIALYPLVLLAIWALSSCYPAVVVTSPQIAPARPHVVRKDGDTVFAMNVSKSPFPYRGAAADGTLIRYRDMKYMYTNDRRKFVVSTSGIIEQLASGVLSLYGTGMRLKTDSLSPDSFSTQLEDVVFIQRSGDQKIYRAYDRNIAMLVSDDPEALSHVVTIYNRRAWRTASIVGGSVATRAAFLCLLGAALGNTDAITGLVICGSIGLPLLTVGLPLSHKSMDYHRLKAVETYYRNKR